MVSELLQPDEQQLPSFRAAGADSQGVTANERTGRLNEKRPVQMKTSLLTFLGSAIYATARYNVFKGVPWSDWPIYTLNKAFALSALLLLVSSVLRKRSAKEYSNAPNLYMAGVFGFIHGCETKFLLTKN
jgi:hypothetical protein